MKTLFFVAAFALMLAGAATRADAGFLYYDENDSRIAPYGQEYGFTSASSEPWVWNKGYEGYTNISGKTFIDSNRLMAVSELARPSATASVSPIEHRDSVFMVPTMECFDPISNVCQMKMYDY